MRILYLDLGMGAAGDMISAALYDLLTEDQKKLYLDQVSKLGLPGVTIQPAKMEKCGIVGTYMAVRVDGEEEADHEHSHVHDHDHLHRHHHNSPSHVGEVIRSLNLSDRVKDQALEVYRDLAEAESRAHGVDVTQIHFHEVGDKDAIADVANACLLLDLIRPDRVIASPAATGSGTVRCAHGILPVPAPATACLLQEKGIPCESGTEDGELLTPTGAALIGRFVMQFGRQPAMVIEKIGYGMGKKDFKRANCLRAILGRTEENKDFREKPKKGASEGTAGETGSLQGKTAREAEAGKDGERSVKKERHEEQPDRLRDRVLELTCNLDDMTPEDIAYACGKLFKAGALDVFTTPIGMKKGRQATMLTALCHEGEREALVQAIFRHTTTLGVREKTCERYILKSSYRQIPLDGGEGLSIQVKESEGYGVRRVKPEYDQVTEAADQFGLSVSEVRDQVRRKI